MQQTCTKIEHWSVNLQTNKNEPVYAMAEVHSDMYGVCEVYIPGHTIEQALENRDNFNKLYNKMEYEQ